jgi:hypothetical protein
MQLRQQGPRWQQLAGILANSARPKEAVEAFAKAELCQTGRKPLEWSSQSC